MPYDKPNPSNNEDGKVFPIAVFIAAASKGLFTPEDVMAFYATETAYDANLNVFVSPQPADATHVAVLLGGFNHDSMVMPPALIA